MPPRSWARRFIYLRTMIKRQITIPIEFSKQLGIENEVECRMQGESLIIYRAAQPAQGEFAE